MPLEPYHVRCRSSNNIISLAQTLRQGSAASPVRHYSCCCPAACGLLRSTIYLGNAVWITCPVSANDPKGHLTQANPSICMSLRPSRLRSKSTTQHTRAAVIVDHRTTVHLALTPPPQLKSLCFSLLLPAPLFSFSRPPTSHPESLQRLCPHHL